MEDYGQIYKGLTYIAEELESDSEPKSRWHIRIKIISLILVEGGHSVYFDIQAQSPLPLRLGASQDLDKAGLWILKGQLFPIPQELRKSEKNYMDHYILHLIGDKTLSSLKKITVTKGCLIVVGLLHTSIPHPSLDCLTVVILDSVGTHTVWLRPQEPSLSSSKENTLDVYSALTGTIYIPEKNHGNFRYHMIGTLWDLSHSCEYPVKFNQ